VVSQPYLFRHVAAYPPGRVHCAVPSDQTPINCPLAAIGCTNQTRRLSHHCPQDLRAGAALQPSGNDLTRRFPLIVEALARLHSRSCIIEGEAVACDDNGVASFDLVRHHRANGASFSTPST
jgi:hypothetical protein